MKNKIGIVNLIIAVLCFGFIFIALFDASNSSGIISIFTNACSTNNPQEQ